MIAAIASGRNAASGIDRYLGGDGVIDEVLTDYEEPDAYIGRVEGFAYEKREEPALTDPAARVHNFEPVESTSAVTRPTVNPPAACSVTCARRLNLPLFWSDLVKEAR